MSAEGRPQDPPHASGAFQSGVALSLPAALHRLFPLGAAIVFRKTSKPQWQPEHAPSRQGTEPVPANGLDYQMLKPAELNDVAKLALLLLSETNGAAVREMNPPRN